MFGFLKDKLKKAVGKFSSDVEKEATIEKKEVEVEIKEEKKGFFSKIFGKKEAKTIAEQTEESTEVKHVDKNSKDKLAEEIIKVEQKALHKKDESITIKKEPIIEKKPENNIKNESVQIQSSIKNAIHSQDSEHANKKQELKQVVSEQIIPSIKTGDQQEQTKPKVESRKKIEAAPIDAIKQDAPIHKRHDNTSSDIKIEEGLIARVEPIEKKGFFTKITETFTKFHISEEKFEELFWELEVVLLENNVAVEVIEKIKQDLKDELMKDKIYRKGVEELILDTLRKSIIELFDIEKIDLIKNIKEHKKPYIITIIGVNGSGKTTSIAKLTHMFQKKGLSVVLAASDTFRAAAIQQLEEHANRLNTKLIKHDYHSDPAAVAFDAIKYAQAHKIDVVMIDTAGRLHSNTNLMKELEKVVRVCKPDIKIFVGESITGNDCIEQAKEFDKAVGIDAIILAKADVDEKGGAAISVSYVLQKPILYLGTGQTYDDMKEFDSRLIIESLEL